MEQYSKFGIEVHEVGESVFNAPVSLKNPEDDTLKVPVIWTGEYISLPLSNTEANQLEADISAWDETIPEKEVPDFVNFLRYGDTVGLYEKYGE